MIWLILIVVVGFLVASALPLIREIAFEKKRREAAAADPVDAEPADAEPATEDEDGRAS